MKKMNTLVLGKNTLKERLIFAIKRKTIEVEAL